MDEVRLALQTLNIMSHQVKYVWIARLYACLPIPEGWSRTESEYNTDTYINMFTKEKTYVRPCYQYIINLLEFMKQENPNYDRIWKIWMMDNDHIFEDGFGRIIVVPNDSLFNVNLAHIVEVKKEKAKNIQSKTNEQLMELRMPKLENYNQFMKNQSKKF